MFRVEDQGRLFDLRIFRGRLFRTLEPPEPFEKIRDKKTENPVFLHLVLVHSFKELLEGFRKIGADSLVSCRHRKDF